MKAIIQREYGIPSQVLQLRELETPTPKAGEVLVRVKATTVAGDDWHLMRGLPYFARTATGLRRPSSPIPGQDLAGIIEAVGEGVIEFAPGDEVFGWNGGTFAEFVTVPVGNLLRKPERLSFEEAASVPVVAFTALQGLRDKGGIKPGHEVLIIGASGGVGTMAVQIAKAHGASVTGVAGARNAQLVLDLGADRVIDYRREDYLAGANRYDIILDLVGDRPTRALRRALTEEGTLVMVGSSKYSAAGNEPRGLERLFMGTVDRWLTGALGAVLSKQSVRPLIHQDSQDDLAILSAMIEAGELKPVVDRTFRLHEAAEALRYQDESRAPGRVVVAP
ncbi:MAG: NAD(P)-dependent alcohol dehydrogenase [Candidatus Limnocylindrales bacterium]